jgi:hypothetical protein
MPPENVDIEPCATMQAPADVYRIRGGGVIRSSHTRTITSGGYMKYTTRHFILFVVGIFLLSSLAQGQSTKTVKGILDFSAKITKNQVATEEILGMKVPQGTTTGASKVCVVNVTAKIVYYADNQVAPIGGQEVFLKKDECRVEIYAMQGFSLKSTVPFNSTIKVPAKAKSIRMECWVIADFGSAIKPRVIRKESSKSTQVLNFLWQKETIDFGKISLKM